MKITMDNVHEFEPHKFCAAASDLGIPPGKFPLGIETTLGNGRPFIVKCAEGEDAIRYVQSEGCITLVIFND